MSTLDLERAEAAALRAVRRLPDARSAFTYLGEDPDAFGSLLARVLVDSEREGLDEIPIAQALRAGVAAEHLWEIGLRLDVALELSMAVTAAIRHELGEERVNALGRSLLLVLTRSYLEAEAAEQGERQQRLHALISISRAVNRTLDPNEVAEAGLRETLRAMNLDAGGIWLTRGENLVLAHTAGLPERVVERLKQEELMGREPISTAIREGTPIQFDVETDDPLLAAYRSTLIVPLRSAGMPLGLLAVGSRRRRAFDESEVGFVSAISDHLAGALDLAFEHRREAHTDFLTGLANRSEFESAVRRELAAVRRYKRPLSLMVMDLDELKQINDTHGHHAGDEAIRSVARVIRKTVRTSDISARLGGDEFGVAMPEAGLAQASEVAARIRDAVRKPNPATGASIEVSFGMAELGPEQSYQDLFDMADRNMYREKRRHAARRQAAAGRLGGSKASSPSTSSAATPSR